MIYAGFWRRTLSLIVDVLVMSPLIALHLTLGYSSPTGLAISSVLMTLVSIAYPVYFLSRWGQTPGKMVARIRVTRLDGSPIGVRQAWLRSAGDILLTLTWTIGILYVVATWDGPEWSALDRGELLSRLRERQPFLAAYEITSQAWYWGELLVLALNKKRRSLHDFIAGTVVLVVQPASSTVGEALAEADASPG